jgi:hypothetical protein
VERRVESKSLSYRGSKPLHFMRLVNWSVELSSGLRDKGRTRL